MILQNSVSAFKKVAKKSKNNGKKYAKWQIKPLIFCRAPRYPICSVDAIKVCLNKKAILRLLDHEFSKNSGILKLVGRVTFVCAHWPQRLLWKTATQKNCGEKKERNAHTPALILSIAESGTVLVVENTLRAYLTAWRGKSVDPGNSSSCTIRSANASWICHVGSSPLLSRS